MRNWTVGAFLLILFAGSIMSCSELVEPVDFNSHPPGWADENDDNFHGNFVLESPAKTESCATCHGTTFEGEVTGISCSSEGCHSVYPHSTSFGNPENPTHPAVIAELNWDLRLCRDCHGQNYDGQDSVYPEKDCTTCHDQPEGPEACDTCHGSAEGFFAPPEDLSGNTSTDFAGVGAHQIHLMTSDLTDVLSSTCSHCHADVDSFSDVNHIDFGPVSAELVFSALATRDGSLLTSYDPATATCSNVYCHGSFEFLKTESSSPFVYTGDSMLGNDLVMGWTEVGADKAACGTCHGLPPTGHAPFPTCSSCHPRVVDSALNIIGTDLHINGEIDLF